MLAASSRVAWEAFGCATFVRGLDWMLGGTTSLTDFMIVMGLSAVFWSSLALIRDSWLAHQERRRIELLRQLSTVDQGALAKRYEELTSHPWPYRR